MSKRSNLQVTLASAKKSRDYQVMVSPVKNSLILLPGPTITEPQISNGISSPLLNIKETTADSLGTAYSGEIRPFIDLIDSLRRFGLQKDVSLPNVVVVGDQSSGKSSIIEAISGIELPRGKGMVTRCPLELQLKRVTKTEPWQAKLSYRTKEGESINIQTTERNQVDKLILEAQGKMCATPNSVSDELITLRVESPSTSAPDLTLIDLPGITRIPVQGQPTDICERIDNIIQKYVRNENTVILCVVSANLDAAVNESIKISRIVDPDGLRTFGVITKPDAADDAQKEDVICMLNNEKIVLAKGYNMVKCRSQKELEDRLSLEKSLLNEQEFFENDKFYKTVNQTKLGTMNLALKITEELVNVIKTTLPGLKDEIFSSLQESQLRLSKLPMSIPDEPQGKWIYLLAQISELNNEIENALCKGRVEFNQHNLFYDWRIHFNNLKKKMDQLKENAMKTRFSIGKLEKEISENRGNEIAGFLNFELFERLIISHIASYKVQAETLLKDMKKTTNTAIYEIIERRFVHLPGLGKKLKSISHKQLQKATEITQKRLDGIFNEENLVFTLDSAFENEMNSLKLEFPHRPIDDLEKNSARMRSIIECYLKVVHSRLSDTIPMAIRQYLHIELNNNLKAEFQIFATTPGVESEMMENRTIREDRRDLNEKVNRLQNAVEELSKF